MKVTVTNIEKKLENVAKLMYESKPVNEVFDALDAVFPDNDEEHGTLSRLDTKTLNKCFGEYGTLLHGASRNGGYIDLAEELIGLECIDINAVDEKGDTPLHIAAANGAYDQVELYTERTDIDINTENKDGCTSLDKALFAEKYHTAGLIFKMGGHPNIEYIEDDGEMRTSALFPIAFCIQQLAEEENTDNADEKNLFAIFTHMFLDSLYMATLASKSNLALSKVYYFDLEAVCGTDILNDTKTRNLENLRREVEKAMRSILKSQKIIVANILEESPGEDDEDVALVR